MTSASHQASTYFKPHRSLLFRLLNGLGDRLEINQVLPLNLTEKSLIEVAKGITGLSDWGNENFRIALRKLLASLELEANLNLVGRYYFRQFLLRLLINRLRLEADWKRYPQILEVPIDRPLFVVGLFRSGTTFLHNLLSQDPASRWLYAWQALYPSPAPNPINWQADPRVEATIAHIRFQDSLAPDLSTAHHIDPTRPAECSRLFEHDFVGHLFDFRASVKTYSDWLYQQDLTESYQYYRQQLQHLSWRWPGRHWVLKAPAHIFSLDALLTAFPDACIIYIHRNPLKVLPSCCSLSSIGRSRFSDRVDPYEIGHYWLNRLSEGTDRAMKVMESADSARFYQLDYQAFLKAPIAKIHEIYHYFGYPFSAEIEANLQTWIENNPQHKRGVHRYSLDQFGLSVEQVERQFSNYFQRFSFA